MLLFGLSRQAKVSPTQKRELVEILTPLFFDYDLIMGTPKIITRRVEYRPPNKMRRILDLSVFYENRQKILIVRNVGGLGDILMHRMLFEDIKLLMPDCEIHFACPVQYHDAVIDHPFIDKVLDNTKVLKENYIVSYNTTSACGRYEMRMAPYADLHRSDIWAQHCGLKLTRHNMHIQLTENEQQYGLDRIQSLRERPGPIALVCPISAMIGKNLTNQQMIGVVDGLRERGVSPIVLHSTPVEAMFSRGVPSLEGLNLRQWLGVIAAADYMISVDTSSLHCAGGMCKPVVGVFTFIDGYVYSQHYPKSKIVQLHRSTHNNWTCGPCYNWGACPKTKLMPKPCLTELTPSMILEGFDQLRVNHPMPN